MNELIKVDFSGERPAVSARELHEFLGVETRFNDWFSRMCEYGFLEGEDFYSFLSKTPTGGRPAHGRRPLHRHGQGDLYATAQ